MRAPIRHPAHAGLAAAGLACACLLVGCLGEPEIDERWTLLEMVEASPSPAAPLAPGQDVPVSVRGRITYRAIRTGFLVAEARYAAAYDAGGLPFDPEVHDLPSALAVEDVLAHSVTAGRATRAVTGFDHLMQTIDLAFDARVPAELGSVPPDSAAYRHLFLVLYLAEGEEIELQDGRDSLVVTPFAVEPTQVLFTGQRLNVTTAGASP